LSLLNIYIGAREEPLYLRLLVEEAGIPWMLRQGSETLYKTYSAFTFTPEDFGFLNFDLK
jgi:hypothetical protein